jgi:hypothetical protein
MSSRWHKEQGEVLSIAGKVLGIAGKSSVELRMAAGFGGRGKQGLNGWAQIRRDHGVRAYLTGHGHLSSHRRI